MKIRMLTSLAGLDYALSPGEVTERFGDEEAVRLVQADYAVVIAGDSEAAVQAPAGEARSEDGAPAVDAPATQPEPDESAPATDVDEKAALVTEAEALGIDVDGRWGIARLKSEIEAAKAAKVTG